MFRSRIPGRSDSQAVGDYHRSGPWSTPKKISSRRTSSLEHRHRLATVPPRLLFSR
ncbi:hypothetical protein P692DRAFT_2035943 [Suillus brevipes Sb2]|nr:hypothetical protein P692DRAFT_2035943 [Suillus brevipes Sb2]